MTPMRRQQPMRGLDATPMAPPSPMQFAAPPPMMAPPDATGMQAIGGLSQLATALQGRLTQSKPVGGAGGAMAGAMGGGPVDAPMRRKTPFSGAAQGQLPYA
jgi:hypothetical protein